MTSIIQRENQTAKLKYSNTLIKHKQTSGPIRKSKLLTFAVRCYAAAMIVHYAAPETACFAHAVVKDRWTEYNSLGVKAFHNGHIAQALSPLNQAKQEALSRHQDFRLVITLSNLAKVYGALGNINAQEEMLREVIAIESDKPNNPFVAPAMLELACLFENSSRIQQGEFLRLEAINKQEQILGVSNPVYLGSFNKLADLYVQQGRFAKALSVIEKTLALRKRNGDKMGTLASLTAIAAIYTRIGKLQMAYETYREAIALAEHLPDKRKFLILAAKDASICETLGKSREMQQLIDKCISPYYALSSKSKTRFKYDEILQLRKDFLNVAEACRRRNDNDRAAKLYSILVKMADRYPAPQEVAHAELISHTTFLREHNNGKQAEELETRQQEWQWELLVVESVRLFQEGYHQQANELIQKSVKLAAEQYGSEDVHVAQSLIWQVWFFCWEHRLKEADSTIRKAMSILERQKKKDPVNFAQMLTFQAAVFQLENKSREARLVRERAIAFRNSMPENVRVLIPDCLSAYSSYLKHLNEGQSVRYKQHH